MRMSRLQKIWQLPFRPSKGEFTAAELSILIDTTTTDLSKVFCRLFNHKSTLHFYGDMSSEMKPWRTSINAMNPY